MYGTASLLLDGTGDYIHTPAHSDFNFGTGDFTIEWFARHTGANAIQYPFELYVDSDNSFTLTLTMNGATSVLTFVNEIANVTTINYSSGNFTTAADAWYHMALVRKNGTMQFFVAGVAKASLVASSTIFYDGATAYRCGNSNTSYGAGWIDDLRISKTAVYPLGADFTPPASAVGLATNGTIATGTTIGIDYQPYFDITDLGKGYTVGAWKNRAVLTTNQDHVTYVSAENASQVFNGDDSTALYPGDGRLNIPVAQRTMGDDLLIWQREKGLEGGCLTKFTWVSSISNITRKVISTTLGTMNSKSVDIVDGVEFSELNRDIPVMSLAFFLSRFGVFVTDKNVCYCISGDIANYFDPTSSACIRTGYESEMWLKYDSAYGVIRIGLVSGSSATVPNVFPVYDVKN